VKKTRNAGYGWASWLGDEWVDGIARGEHASQTAARELAHEVATMRHTRLVFLTGMRAAIELLRETHGPGAADGVIGVLRIIATTDEVAQCLPTDTPPSDASVDPPPRARSSG
jgi:hypothetical protein